VLSILPKKLDLPKLEELYVQNNKIENLEIISSCAALKKLNCEQNPIHKMPILANFSRLYALKRGGDVSELGISQTDRDWFFAFPLALREALFASMHKKNTYGKNLLQIMAHIQLFGKQLSTLAGLETAHNCQRLDIPNNQIQDLSPLSGLKKLARLNCSKNLIQDFNPIQALPIVNLNCANNPIKDYHFLQKMQNLQTLDCSKTGLSILHFLKYCPDIQQVICKRNPVFILPIQKIPNLRSLELSTHSHKLTDKKIRCFRQLNPQCTLKFS
jgi:Leucine-rich repeat (LRR) protein